MIINILVSKFNTVVIDPTVTINSGVVNGYTAHFEFQEQWNSTLKLFAVFKPVNDVPISIALDENNNCVIPSQIYKRFAKLGIGIKGITKDERGNIIDLVATNLFYIPIKNSGINQE